MIEAEACDVGEHGERNFGIEMRLDIVAHALQPFRRKTLAGRQRETPDKTPGEADTQSRAQAFDQDPVCKAAFDLLGKVVAIWPSKGSCG